MLLVLNLFIRLDGGIVCGLAGGVVCRFNGDVVGMEGLSDSISALIIVSSKLQR